MKCIYAIENKINNKKYIGMTNNYQDRIYNHFYELKNNKHHSVKLQRAFNKYGEENFCSYVLLETNDMNGLELKEKEYIKRYDTYKNGYNCSEGGEKCPDYKMPINTRIALAKANKNNKHFLGKHHKKASKIKLSKANGGKNNGMYGKHHSEETKQELSKHSKMMWENNYEKMKNILSDRNKSDKRRKEVSIQMSGENNPKSKVLKQDVINIRKRYDNGERPRMILKDYPMLSKSGLMKICIRETWKNI